MTEVAEERLNVMTQAVGMAATIKGNMQMDPENPVGMVHEVCQYVNELKCNLDAALDAGEMLWTVVANVDWDKQTDEWRLAAMKWRDKYFAVVSTCRPTKREEGAVVAAQGAER